MTYNSNMSKSSHKRLAKLISEFGLTSVEIANLCRVKVGTVHNWRKDPSVESHNTMPEGSLELLELKLGKRELELYGRNGRS